MTQTTGRIEQLTHEKPPLPDVTRLSPVRSDDLLADAIVEDLFRNGNGDEAQRLVLMSYDGRDLGGWCRKAVHARIVKHMTANATHDGRRIRRTVDGIVGNLDSGDNDDG